MVVPTSVMFVVLGSAVSSKIRAEPWVYADGRPAAFQLVSVGVRSQLLLTLPVQTRGCPRACGGAATKAKTTTHKSIRQEFLRPMAPLLKSDKMAHVISANGPKKPQKRFPEEETANFPTSRIIIRIGKKRKRFVVKVVKVGKKLPKMGSRERGAGRRGRGDAGTQRHGQSDGRLRPFAALAGDSSHVTRLLRTPVPPYG
jgi:hypothetical protein